MSEKKVTTNVKLEGATMIFKNFSGKKTEYNDEGNRNFGVLIDDDLAEALTIDGWNVKHRPPRPDDPEKHEQAWLPVKVKFGMYPPTIVLITSKGKIKLDEETVGQLDWSRIKYAYMIIRPYNYPARNGRPSGVSAYLKSLYVTVIEDDFALKYADIPDLDEPYDPYEIGAN